MKKIIALVLALVLTVAASVAGTVAYLQAEDSDVNVMTLGNVEIEQHEYQRAEGVDHINSATNPAKEGDLVPYENFQPLYPAVPSGNLPYTAEPNDLFYWGFYTGGNGGNGLWDDAKLANVMDKFVFVENTGVSDAYFRTIVAFECPEGMTVGDAGAGDDIGMNVNRGFAAEPEDTEDNVYIEHEGVRYDVRSFTYGDWNNGVLSPGETARPSLLQVVMNHELENEDVAKFGDTYEIMVLSQAVQTEGFANAAEALDTAFGELNAENAAEWFKGIAIPNEGDPAPANEKVEYNGTEYDDIYAAVAAANANGGGTITMKGSAKLDKPVEIASNITIVGNGAAYTRADGYTGTMFTVTGATLTMEDVILDGDGATATGNLIATEGNGSIILNAGTVLMNNDGAHAVSLATRGGGTLTLNGAEIINNSSDSGAIWGGGHIIINEGSKINNNNSTGSAGAIRMVSSCNLTMNGGEICNNTAAANGGAIWGYGASTYNLSGGKISGNAAAVGGGIYTGDSSVVNVSGTFEMTDNTANDAGAMRLSNRTAFNMSGGKISGNTSTNTPDYDGFYGWNPGVNLSGGELGDDITINGGLTPTIKGVVGDGVIHFALSTNHNTANLAKDFTGFNFTVAGGTNFAAFNLKPAAGYTYTAGDEAKLVCMNEGYSTYWDAATSTFRIKAV